MRTTLLTELVDLLARMPEESLQASTHLSTSLSINGKPDEIGRILSSMGHAFDAVEVEMKLVNDRAGWRVSVSMQTTPSDGLA